MSGPNSVHVVAFARSWKNQRLIFAVGRHFASITDGGRHWPQKLQATIEDDMSREYEDVLSTLARPRVATLEAESIFSKVPVAALMMRRGVNQQRPEHHRLRRDEQCDR